LQGFAFIKKCGVEIKSRNAVPISSRRLENLTICMNEKELKTNIITA